MSQNDRVLALLRSRGEQGLRTTELQELPTADGGPPVLRLAARIGVLKGRGFQIESERLSNGTAVYRLVSDFRAAPSPGQETAGGSPQGTTPPASHNLGGELFDADAFTSQADYRDAEAA